MRNKSLENEGLCHFSEVLGERDDTKVQHSKNFKSLEPRLREHGHTAVAPTDSNGYLH